MLIAVISVVDAATAAREEQVATELASLAERTKGIPIRTDRPIEPGRYALAHLLDMLSAQINV